MIFEVDVEERNEQLMNLALGVFELRGRNMMFEELDSLVEILHKLTKAWGSFGLPAMHVHSIIVGRHIIVTGNEE